MGIPEIPKRAKRPSSSVASIKAKPKTVTQKPEKVTKLFSVGVTENSIAGEKILLYADTGMGKSTLASMAPSPVFIDPDDGCAELRNPITNKKVQRVLDADGMPPSTFGEIRDALHSYDSLDGFDTVVLDNATVVEDLAVPYMLDNVPTEGGSKAKNIVAYGYNKGYQHLYDLMKLIIQDCDMLRRKGKNIIIVAQSSPNRVSNPAGDDYLRDGPRLCARNGANVESLYCEWASHILRIDYQGIWASKAKKVTGDTTRIIYTQPEAHFRAKSRILANGETLEPIISFSQPDDNSIWEFMFKGE